jgi:hypothetical protein
MFDDMLTTMAVDTTISAAVATSAAKHCLLANWLC